MKRLLMAAMLFLAACAGAGNVGHLTCYKLNGEVMFDADVSSVYVAEESKAWIGTDADGVRFTVTGDCVFYQAVGK